MARRAYLVDRARPIALIVLLAILAYGLAESDALQRLNHLIYDTMLTWQNHRASDEVVIVAIDDESLQQLGRWPWSRQRHADLLDRLTTMQARAVGFDVLFSEPQTDDQNADDRFAAALTRNGRTAIAVAPTHPVAGHLISEVMPLPDLAAAAAGLGHVDIEIDADGLCRSFFAYAGIGNAHWPAFSLSLMQIAGHPASGLADRGNSAQAETQEASAGWLRKQQYFIPFDPRPDAYRTIPAYKLFGDEDFSDMIRGKYVLIGSTAAGLGDVVSTPVSFDHQRMPGVVLNAHVLSGLIQGKLTQELAQQYRTPLTLACTVLGAILMVSAGFPAGTLLFFAAILGVLLTTAALLIGWQLWFPPAAAIVPLVIGFPLWGAWVLLRERRINKSLTVQMMHQALHHAATDLPNQYLLEQRLNALAESDSEPTGITALMIVHIAWSDSAGGMVGRSAGDELLRAIGSRLIDAVRTGDLVAHLSGDDFGILMQLETPSNVQKISQNLMDKLRQSIDMPSTPVTLLPRMGMSLWPTSSPDCRTLLRDAYIAMFRARMERSSTPCTYSEDIAREVEAHSQLEYALVSAMQREEFEVYYQPQFSTVDDTLVGVEALLRWHNPTLGLVYPGTFIPVAEHNGLIQEIGAWVLSTACHQVRRWNEQRLSPIRLAVNLSPLQFIDGDLVNEVCRALRESGLEAHHLELEITESALMQNMNEATEMMHALKELGVKLAIDDFGTGYSSLQHLQNFPLDRIKIDQSFTREISENVDVQEITLTIIQMAKRLQLAVIAEGVETASQVAFLNQNGCDELQGFFFSHPLPSSELTALLVEPTQPSGSATDAVAQQRPVQEE